MFPSFSVADNGQTYDNERMAGGFHRGVFCRMVQQPLPYHDARHLERPSRTPRLVMSTDPAENAGSMTLSDWHDSATHMTMKKATRGLN